MKKEINWAEYAAKRELKPIPRTKREPEPEPDEPPCEHKFIPGKKHCRLCGERELNVWLDKQIYPGGRK